MSISLSETGVLATLKEALRSRYNLELTHEEELRVKESLTTRTENKLESWIYEQARLLASQRTNAEGVVSKISSVADFVRLVTDHDAMDEIAKFGDSANESYVTTNDGLLPRELCLWFRGDQDLGYNLVPSVFREKYNERALFHDLKTRFRQPDLVERTPFDILTFAKHYDLPVRLLDWSSNPLVALYFAVADWEEDSGHRPVVTMLNSHRLNSISSLFVEDIPGAFQAHHLDVQMRLLMMQHRFLHSVHRQVLRDYKTRRELLLGNRVSAILSCLEHIVELFEHDDILKPGLAKIIEARQAISSRTSLGAAFLQNGCKRMEALKEAVDAYKRRTQALDFNSELAERWEEKVIGYSYHAYKDKLSMPVAVLPNRYEDRPYVQSSCFTLHGGKTFNQYYKDCYVELIPEPTHLDAMNTARHENNGIELADTYGSGRFLKRFEIETEDKTPLRIKRELRDMGVHRAAVYPDIGNQCDFLKKRWRERA